MRFFPLTWTLLAVGSALALSCSEPLKLSNSPPSTSSGESTLTSSSQSAAQSDASSEAWYPLVVSKQPFVFDNRWPDCVHAGVTEQCEDGWCRIPAGCFIFGSPEDTPFRSAVGEEQGPVTLTYDMEVMQYETTWAQYDQVTGWPRTIYMNECGQGQCPAKMSWWEAMLFANLLSDQHEPPLEHCYDLGDNCVGEPGDRMRCLDYQPKQPGFECQGYRLPNRYEWQYIARAGTATDFYAGPLVSKGLDFCGVEPALHRIAWYCGNNEGMAAHPVGELLPNAWGLYDILGNAIEFHQTPGFPAPGTPVVDPVEPNASGQTLTDAAGGNIVFSPVSMRVATSLNANFAATRLVRTLGTGVLPQLQR